MIISSLQTIVNSGEKYKEMVQVSSKVLSNLIEDVLDFAKIEAGNLDLNFNPFSISSLIEEIRFIFENQFHRKHLYFYIEWEENVRNAYFNSDFARIRQILINIISNSFKFTHQGGINLSVDIFTKRENNLITKYIKFTVTDTGSGISEDDKRGKAFIILTILYLFFHNKTFWLGIFKLFDAVKHHRDVFHMKGIGLGLTITKKLVSSLEGEISLTSEENKGTEVSFTIPYYKYSNEDESVNEEFDVKVQKSENKLNQYFLTQETPFKRSSRIHW